MTAPFFSLLLLGLILALAQTCHSLTLPLNTTHATPALLAAACLNQGTRNVCHPMTLQMSTMSGKDYIQCGSTPMAKKCAGGNVFDYVKRSCVASAVAKPCPTWFCPAGRGPALGRPAGMFGAPGNMTINLTKKETFTVQCPIDGHCLSGMVFNIISDCPAPADRTPYTFYVDFEETLHNDMAFPKRLADIQGYCGDKVFVEWDEPIHLAQVFDTSSAAKPLWKDMSIIPYPPQPVYSCPSWDANMEGFPVPNPGDEVLLPQGEDHGIGPANTTWTASKPETFFFVCPLGAHCRLGMIFKVVVKAAPAAYTPKKLTIPFVLTYDQFPDLDLTVGDSIYFFWPAQMAHALYKIDNVTIL